MNEVEQFEVTECEESQGVGENESMDGNENVGRSEHMVSIAELTIDKEIQPRKAQYDSVVTEYKKAMEEGAEFPPIVVFRDTSGRLLLADGFLRVRAAEKIGVTELEAEFQEGGRTEAILYAVKANSTHGVRISSADKQRAIEKLL